MRRSLEKEWRTQLKEDDGVKVISREFADDTALTTVTHDHVVCEQQLQVSVNATPRWLSDWRLKVNTEKKNVVMEFTRRPIPPHLTMNLDGKPL